MNFRDGHTRIKPWVTNVLYRLHAFYKRYHQNRLEDNPGRGLVCLFTVAYLLLLVFCMSPASEGEERLFEFVGFVWCERVVRWKYFRELRLLIARISICTNKLCTWGGFEPAPQNSWLDRPIRLLKVTQGLDISPHVCYNRPITLICLHLISCHQEIQLCMP